MKQEFGIERRNLIFRSNNLHLDVGVEYLMRWQHCDKFHYKSIFFRTFHRCLKTLLLPYCYTIPWWRQKIALIIINFFSFAWRHNCNYEFDYYFSVVAIISRVSERNVTTRAIIDCHNLFLFIRHFVCSEKEKRASIIDIENCTQNETMTKCEMKNYTLEVNFTKKYKKTCTWCSQLTSHVLFTRKVGSSF
jgi:hypothetical protein